MNISAAFKHIQNVKYRAGGVYSPTHQFSLVNQDIWVNENSKFSVKFPNIWMSYKLPKITDLKLYDTWNSNPMQFWQNQLNFAVWVATTGCGVSKQQHLGHQNHLIKSLYRFHVYYQIRKILRILECPLPGDKYFDALNNNINLRSYAELCDDFGISQSSDFRQKLDSSNGLGSVIYYSLHGLRPKTKILERGGDYDKQRKLVIIPQTKFGGGPPHRYKVEYIEQFFAKGVNPTEHKVELSKQPSGSNFDAIGSFVLDEGKGFTQAGITKINDSIRTFVWAILGAQSQARTSILGKGRAFDAPKLFLANVETTLNSAIDLPSSIDRYQKTLGYARSKVDFVVGFDLYMMPSDMDLYIGKINGYNNLLVDAGESDITLVLGKNEEVNDLPVMKEEVEDNVVNNPETDEPSTSKVMQDINIQPVQDTKYTVDEQGQVVDAQGQAVDALTHDETKLLLILGGGVVISSLIWVLK